MFRKIRSLLRLLLLCIAASLTACAGTTLTRNNKPAPQQNESSFFSQLGKSDFDHLADVEMRENSLSLQVLMTKLYKRNPRELRKSSSGNVDDWVKSVFTNQHDWQFDGINKAQSTDAIQQAFKPEYQGDRVLSFIVGLQTMLIRAHGGKTEFYLTDTIEPQNIYNAARNIEIAVWKLSSTRNEKGELYLLTNELNDRENNLSFEREFGKMIGSLDLYAITLSEKLQRGITRTVQTFATTLFLPITLKPGL